MHVQANLTISFINFSAYKKNIESTCSQESSVSKDSQSCTFASLMIANCLHSFAAISANAASAILNAMSSQ